MINEHEHVVSCMYYYLCPTPLYTGKCSDECIKKHYKEFNSSKDKAKWKHRAEYNDFIFAECSNCGFMEEAWKVVRKGESDCEYVEVKYKFCPMCGKAMGV